MAVLWARENTAFLIRKEMIFNGKLGSPKDVDY